VIVFAIQQKKAFKKKKNGKEKTKQIDGGHSAPHAPLTGLASP